MNIASEVSGAIFLFIRLFFVPVVLIYPCLLQHSSMQVPQYAVAIIRVLPKALILKETFLIYFLPVKSS